MKAQKYFQRWKRRYLKLLHKQWMLLRQSRRSGQPEQVHDLRVILRRLRLMIRLGAPVIDDTVANEYRRWSRTVSTATSRLRDYDVTLEWLKGQNGTKEIVELLRARRDRLWRIQKNRLTPPTGKVRSQLSRISTGRKKVVGLRKHFRKQLDRLQNEAFHRLPHFFKLNLEERHAFRRTLRRLRYLRELALSRKKQAGDEMLKHLIRSQGAMGEYQNLVIAEQIVRHLPRAGTSAVVIRALKKQRIGWNEQIRRGLKGLNESRQRERASPRVIAVDVSESPPSARA
jgi:CHAD domain-containing protein